MQQLVQLVRTALVVLTSLWAFFGPTAAQTAAANPLRIIIPGPPGGTLDQAGHWLGACARQQGRASLLDYRPGAGGSLGAKALLGAEANADALLLHLNTVVTEASPGSHASYDVLRDLLPIAELARAGLVLIGHSNLPARDFRELSRWASGLDRPLTVATYGDGTTSDRLARELAARMGWRITSVPYRGSPPALQDVLGERIDLMFDSPLSERNVRAVPRHQEVSGKSEPGLPIPRIRKPPASACRKTPNKLNRPMRRLRTRRKQGVEFHAAAS